MLSLVVIIAEAVSCMERAIEQYLEIGRFTIAAKHHQTIAEIWEAEGDLERSVVHYEQAADYFKGEESNASGNKCLLKVAQHAAQMEDYVKAIKVYEEVKPFNLRVFRIIKYLNLATEGVQNT